MSVEPDRTARESAHARPGPVVVPRRRRGGDPASAPQHRAGTTGRRRGTRARGGGPGALPWRAVSAGAAVLGVTAVAVVLVGGGPDRSVGVDGPGSQASSAPRAAATPGASAAATAAPAAAPAASPSAPAPAAVAPLPRTASAAADAALAGQRTLTTTQPALEELLAERAALSTALLRAVVTGDDASAEAAQTALSASGADLERVLAPWTGAPVAESVLKGWEAQAAASRAYAQAVRDGDSARADAARADMGETSRALGALLDRLTDGRIATYVPPQDAARLRAFVDALAAGDGPGAAETERWLRARLHREGTALAGGLSVRG